MSLGSDFKLLKEASQPACRKCIFYHALPSPATGHSGTCNLNPPQVVSHEGKLHYVFPAVALDWYCGHFAPN
ncbi:MAG: hypothetical protein BMS9Abin37_2119 [Acidobacteriota bacterium]|nr:MAG: hypothetical protein BMS9Abin37_2119 [Acidobacteriota bacterium]